MSSGTKNAQVLVVGAGPVGLLAATALVLRGIDVRIIDARRQAAGPPEGLVLHPRSLLLLDRLGLCEALIERGRRIDRLGLYLGAERVAVIDESHLPSAYPFALTLPQHALVEALEGELARRRVHVQWQHQLLAIEQDDEHVQLEIARLEKESLGHGVAHTEWVVDSTTHWQVRYAIATDGPRSLALARIGAGHTSVGREHYVAFETRAGPDTGAEARVGLGEEHLLYSMWPAPNGLLRWIVQLDRPLSGVRDSELLRLLGQRAPWFRPLPVELERRTTFQVERWLSRRLGRGRIWLAGDAAHQTGPIASQGINSGLQEAFELADAVSLAVAGSGERALRAYAERYQRDWERLLCIGFAPARVSGAPAWSELQGERLAAALPATGADLGLLLRWIGLAYPPAA